MSFYLLYEIFMKADEQQQYSEFRIHVKDSLGTAIRINNWFDNSIYDEIMKRGNINDKIKAIWDQLVQENKGKSHYWCYFIKSFRPKIRDDILQEMISKIKEAMNHFHEGRHYNVSKTINPVDYKPSIEVVEDFILALEQPYVEIKEVLDDILEETNTKAN